MEKQSLLDRLYHIGVRKEYSGYLKTRIILCNQYNFSSGIIAFLASIVIAFNTPAILWLMIVAFLILVAMYFFNNFGLVDLSRFITAIAGVIISSVANGYANPGYTSIDPGGLMLTLSFFVSSFLMFDVREKGYLFSSLVISIFFCLAISGSMIFL